MQILTGLILYSTLSSVQQRQQLYQERWLKEQKFLSYCIYSGVISAVVYPIEAHWIWGGGWLAQMGFHDFAGSAAIHTVGGLTAFIGAAMVGPRIW